MDKNMQAIQNAREWRLSLSSSEDRKISLARIASVDGVGDRGQFYITAQMPSPGGKVKMVVTASFLDKNGKKLSAYGKTLFREGAGILWKWSEGTIAAKRDLKTVTPGMQKYMDVTAVFTQTQEEAWQAEGLL
jgi:hypothetical protein